MIFIILFFCITYMHFQNQMTSVLLGTGVIVLFIISKCPWSSLQSVPRNCMEFKRIYYMESFDNILGEQVCIKRRVKVKEGIGAKITSQPNKI